MSKPITEGAPLLSLALCLTERANWASQAAKRSGRFGIVSQDEAESFCFSLTLGIALLLQGRPCSPGVVGAFKRLAISAIECADLLGFIDCLSQIREVLVHHGHWDRSLFKEISSRWLRGLSAAIEHAVDTSLCTHPSQTFDDVVTFCGWLKRLPVCIRPISQSVCAYKSNEERLGSIDFDSNRYVPQLRQIWFEWFRNFRITEPFLAKHGSGSTADAGRWLRDKWNHLEADTVADVCMRYPSLEKIIDFPIGLGNRTAKVVFVPKQAGKDRTICMEPAWLQYLQQGIARQLVDYSHHAFHPLSRMVDVLCQDKNRALCAGAWIKGLSTLDLTDASDSISFELMKRLTKGLPLARYYYASRSHSAVLQNEVIPLGKFAPMGSALCFITECFVFASVVELAFRIHFGSASRGFQSGISVYGDDIICPSEINYLVVDILHSLGFMINDQKSCLSGPYYESCGVEYLFGALINTIKHPRTHLFEQKKVVSPAKIGTVTDLANTLRASHYFSARRILLKYFEKIEVRVNNKNVPFMKLVRFDPKGLVPMVDPYTPTRWDVNLQRATSSQLHCQAVYRRSSKDYHHFQWLTIEENRGTQRRVRPPIQEPAPIWSTKAVLCLSRFRHWDLLRDGELREAGSCRTGPLRHVLRHIKTVD